MATAQSQSVASAVSSLRAVGHWRGVHVQRRQPTPLALFESVGRARAGDGKRGRGGAPSMPAASPAASGGFTSGSTSRGRHRWR
eukprot:COSAG06_NODE_2360_length_7005_cov_13.853026_10_plen_84_part_00